MLSTLLLTASALVIGIAINLWVSDAMREAGRRRRNELLRSVDTLIEREADEAIEERVREELADIFKEAEAR